ncbi:response regulator [Paraburkholderia sp. UYCP14C]|uniref:response regulator n=1 Tax=Paraburkholderia sp. UYCP14C TaxID=2511130 RepID=UPI0010208468|nr:response regulator [Paraburkholderia sp. UYCP14C]RZF30449.1 response regulator [Paraburkholderia sp. UYCP14C]
MSDPIATVLLIEGDRHLRRYVRTSLETEAMRVLNADTGPQGIAITASVRPDLVIVDPGLENLGGIDVIRQLRGWSDVPIIVLSDQAGDQEKVTALDAGADDYLTKPFSIAELEARIRALLRRYNRCVVAQSASVSFGSVTVDLSARMVRCGREHVHLTPVEYRLLVALVRHAGLVMTHCELLQEVWGPAHAQSLHYLRIYMAHLRQKLERDPSKPEHLVTETGIGYRLIV